MLGTAANVASERSAICISEERLLAAPFCFARAGEIPDVGKRPADVIKMTGTFQGSAERAEISIDAAALHTEVGNLRRHLADHWLAVVETIEASRPASDGLQ
jgi:hypothetical protein